MPGWVKHKLESRFWEKYQQPQICKWYYSSGSRRKGVAKSWTQLSDWSDLIWSDLKEHLDEGKRELKICLVKASIVFLVAIYRCESWTIKEAEHWRIDAIKLWCWSRLLRAPWTARRSNQSILKEISPNIHWKDWCWSWNSNTLATWGEEPTLWKRPWCWERLKTGGERRDRGWHQWIVSLTQWTWVWAKSGR